MIPRSIDIKITPSRPDKSMNKVIRDFISYANYVSKGIAEDMIRTARWRTPVHSGKTRDGWTLSRKTHGDGSADIVLKNLSNVIDYLNDGTSPSAGMFLWNLERRRVNPKLGWHPGIRATRLFDNIVKDTKSAAQDWADRIPRELRISFKRSFK